MQPYSISSICWLHPQKHPTVNILFLLQRELLRDHRRTPRMILGQISWIDCIVFVLFLTPQLLIQVNIWELLTTVLAAVPYLGRPVFKFNIIQIIKIKSSLHHTFSIPQGKILGLETWAESVRTKCYTLWRLCGEVCKICFCKHVS